MDDRRDRHYGDATGARQRHLLLKAHAKSSVAHPNLFERRRGIGGDLHLQTDALLGIPAFFQGHIDAAVIGVGHPIERQDHGLILGRPATAWRQ